MFSTALYKPPEAQKGKVSICGRKSDVWSFGCMVLELVTGKLLPIEFASLAPRASVDVDTLVARTISTTGITSSWVKDVLSYSLQA